MKIAEARSVYSTQIKAYREQHTILSKSNMEVAKQQGEAMEKSVEDLGKIMEVARRLMDGDIVPPTDEKKLMEYSMELYQAAKNIGVLMKKKESKEYDSLWEEEKEKNAVEDPTQIADNAEAFASGPAIVEVIDTISNAVNSEGV